MAARAVAGALLAATLAGCSWFADPVSAPGCPAWLKVLKTNEADVLTVPTKGRIVALNQKIEELCK